MTSLEPRGEALTAEEVHGAAASEEELDRRDDELFALFNDLADEAFWQWVAEEGRKP